MSGGDERGAGFVTRVTGPVVVARDVEGARLHDVVRVGQTGLVGEVIRLEGAEATVQVYEETEGLRVGAAVVSSGAPLSVDLGPGLLGSVFDGLQRPLAAHGGEDEEASPWIEPGARVPALDPDRTWDFRAAVEEGDDVAPGDVLGRVEEQGGFEHRILAPPDRRGRVTRVESGERTVEDPVVWLDDEPIPMRSRWPVRRARPVARRLQPVVPMITGQRVIDVLFPVAQGGAATVPGGFGTGKTVIEQVLARHARIDVVVFVACGERGNELTEMLEAFREGGDESLARRTVLVANTSNMPIAARESSIYTGMAMAEYFRDQGRHVALMADSTSRWGEALREVSARLEEMPGEEGYPAYLPARLAAFYERAGRARCLSAAGDDEEQGRVGSVTVIGAVSPPGGDFSEPITQQSLRLAGTFWSLDADLARRRHYPAIHWGQSFTHYDLDAWFAEEVDEEWGDLRRWALALLQEEDQLRDLEQLMGREALGERQRVLLRVGRILREDLLQQDAFDEVDAACPPDKAIRMLRLVRLAQRRMERALDEGMELREVLEMEALDALDTMKCWPPEEAEERAQALAERLEGEVSE
ncbi:MAG: V-type ATP synthase subunit A [Myxococcota bacterium]